MFCLDRKILVKKPSVWAEWHTPRVGLRIGKAAYHLEVGEALALANRLVDVAEMVESRKEETGEAQDPVHRLRCTCQSDSL